MPFTNKDVVVEFVNNNPRRFVNLIEQHVSQTKMDALEAFINGELRTDPALRVSYTAAIEALKGTGDTESLQLLRAKRAALPTAESAK